MKAAMSLPTAAHAALHGSVIHSEEALFVMHEQTDLGDGMTL